MNVRLLQDLYALGKRGRTIRMSFVFFFFFKLGIEEKQKIRTEIRIETADDD